MIKIAISGLKALSAELKRLESIEKQVRFAAAKAINATAKKIVEAENMEVARIIDRPLPKTLRSVEVLSYARSPDRLEAVIALRGIRLGVSASEARTGGSKGTITPHKYMRAHVVGGTRAAKRFENALIKARVMPAGLQAVFAKRSNALDPYGNLPGGKIKQILSWFQAFPEAGRGFRTNMKASTKDKMIAGKRKGMKWGVAYFRGGKGTDLPDGIWERHYPNGQSGKSFIRPILIYTRPGLYRKNVRFNLRAIAERVYDESYESEFSAQLVKAFATAR